MRQGPEGDTPNPQDGPWEVSAGPWRQQVKGWPGIWWEVRQPQ